MIKDVTPAKLYKISNNHTLIVIEDRDGELHDLVFSDREILKGRFRGVRYSHEIPEYKLKVCCCTEVFVISSVVSLIVGILTGWFLGM